MRSALLLLLLPLSLAADVVITRDGRRLVGEVIRKDGRVIVRMKLGSVALDAKDVVRIEPGTGFADQFDRRLAALADDDRAGRLKLAGWARARGLAQRATRLYRDLARGGSKEAQQALVALLLEGLVSRGRQPSKAQEAELKRYAGPTAAWLVARFSRLSKKLADRIAADGKPDLAACVALYRQRRGELLALVRGGGFDARAPRRLRDRALSLYRGLLSLYRGKRLRPFVVGRYAARLEELRQLEDLALTLGVALPASVPHEDALDRLAGPVDRAALDRRLGITGRLVAVARANDAFGVDRAERELIRLINRYRDMLGLSLVRLESRLCKASERHTRDMLRLKFFGHDSPVRRMREPTDRVRAAGYPWRVVGEVLARKSEDPVAVFEAFLHSPTHHRTLVHAGFKEVGIGKIKDYWTVELATRR